jgi:hypothetical protein
MELAHTAPDPSAVETTIGVAFVLLASAISIAAIIVGVVVWLSRPDPLPEARAPIGYTLVLAASVLLVLTTATTILGSFALMRSTIEPFGSFALAGQLPIAFAVFAYAIFRERPTQGTPGTLAKR